MITMTTVHGALGFLLIVFTILLWRLFEDIRKNGDGA